MWEIIPRIGTPLALAAFVVAVAGWIFYTRIKERSRMIMAASPEDRAKLVEATLATYRLSHDNLTREQKFELLQGEMRIRSTRALYTLVLSIVVAVLLSIVIVVYLLRDGENPTPRTHFGPPKGEIRKVVLEKTAVLAQVANVGRAPFAINSGDLVVKCRTGSETKTDLKVTEQNGELAPGQELSIRLRAYYGSYTISLPPTRGCDFRLSLSAARGAKVTTLEAKGTGDAASPSEQVTMFEFTGGPDSKQPYSDYVAAVREAVRQASSAIVEDNTQDVELLEIPTAETGGNVPQSESALAEIQRRSRSILLASGAVTREETGYRVRSSMFAEEISRELRNGLLNVTIPFGKTESFVLARQLNEVAIYYSLARLAASSKPTRHNVVIGYLRLADNTARSMLETELSGELRPIVENWRKLIGPCLESLVGGRTPWCA